MGARLFVGNLAYATTEQDVRKFFEEQGFGVDDISLIRDRAKDRSAGFGFVTLADSVRPGEATRAIGGKSLAGRPLNVRDTSRKEREDRGGRGGRGNKRGKRG